MRIIYPGSLLHLSFYAQLRVKLQLLHHYRRENSCSRMVDARELIIRRGQAQLVSFRVSFPFSRDGLSNVKKNENIESFYLKRENNFSILI
jgi:hypothetical protein